MKITQYDLFNIPPEYRENFVGLTVRKALSIIRNMWWHDSRMDGGLVIIWLNDDSRIEATQAGIVRLDRYHRVVRRY